MANLSKKPYGIRALILFFIFVGIAGICGTIVNGPAPISALSVAALVIGIVIWKAGDAPEQPSQNDSSNQASTGWTKPVSVADKTARMFLDPERTELDVKYIVESSGSIKSATTLYKKYASCTEAKATKAIQSYLAQESPELVALYPQHELAIRDGDIVAHVSLAAHQNKEKRAKWLTVSHPFFQFHSSNPDTSAGLFFDYLSTTVFRHELANAFEYVDHHIEYAGSGANGTEASDEIFFRRLESYSYHDGGGGCEDTLRIRPVSEQEQAALVMPDELMTKEYYEKIHASMPPCKGYWEDNDVVYLLNPCEMEGAFVLEIAHRDWDLND